MAELLLNSVDPWFQCFYLLLDCSCEGCGKNPEALRTLWEANDLPPGNAGAEEWCVHAAAFLREAGWKVINQMPYCAACARRHSGQ